MSGNEKIPTSVIGILSTIVADRYTHTSINSLFLYANAPIEVPTGSKPDKVQAWLRNVNNESTDPLAVLGVIIDDFMVRDPSSFARRWDDSDKDQTEAIEGDRQKIRDTLARDGLSYVRGGNIIKGSSAPTLSLNERVKKQGLPAVEIEIKRAIEKIEEDPHAAAHYAGNVLEAVLKAYLDKKGVSYADGDALNELWSVAAAHMGLRPKDMDDKDLKMIASGLHSVVGGIGHLRNKKSAAHGKSETQRKLYEIKPRHARLAIHAAHTVAVYVLDVME